MFNIIKRSRRVMCLNLLFVFAFSAILIRLTYVKIIKAKDYYNLAVELWTRSAPVSGARGNIYDRNGNLLVSSKLLFAVVVIPKQIEDKEKVALEISKITSTDYEDILSHLNKNVSVQILKPELSYITSDMAARIIQNNFKGIYVVQNLKRSYLYGNLLAPIIGIVGSDAQGLTGIEYLYDSYLQGEKGRYNIYTDAKGNLMASYLSTYDTATNGNDVYLTIDLDIQLSLERLIENCVAKYNPDEVMMIAMNPNTFEIYGMASYPSFDLENYADYAQELYNRNLPIWKCYEPGSVQKIITYAAGLEEGVFSTDEIFNDAGYLVIDGVKIKDWKIGGHGKQTFLEVIQNSCNPGFMTIGLRLGKNKLFSYIKNFGLGTKTGIDLLGEASGILFDEEQIGNVEVATSSFGQGNAVTAIQLIAASCAAINGGNLYKPYILQKIVSSNGEIIKNNEKEIIRKVISEETSSLMRYALECVVSKGTARNAYIDGYRIGGKTGTAQIAENGSYADGKYILSFLGIAPMNDPQIAIYIAINNPKNCIQYGGVVAAPIVREALIDAFASLKIPLQEEYIPLEVRPYIDKNTYIVDNYIGKTISEINRTYKYNYIYEGNGSRIIAQLPEAGERIIEGGYVILYTN